MRCALQNSLMVKATSGNAGDADLKAGRPVISGRADIGALHSGIRWSANDMAVKKFCEGEVGRDRESYLLSKRRSSFRIALGSG